MIEVNIKENEPFEKALRRFKKKWEKAGVLKAVKSKTFYLKPSEKRKLERSNFVKKNFSWEKVTNKLKKQFENKLSKWNKK